MAEIYVIASGKGGVGKSTFVAGASRALALLGKKVLAVDGDIGLRSLDLLLGCGEKVVFDWGDVVLGRCEAQKAVVEGNVDFIAAPRAYDEAFTAEGLKKALTPIFDNYDFVFIDAPAGIDTGFRIAAGCADKALVVTTPDCVCVRSCGRANSELCALGITDTKLIVNMFEMKPVSKGRLLNIDECMDETCVPLAGVIPMDRKLAFSSVTGTEPGEFSPSSQAFMRIAKRLTGQKVKLVCE